MCTHVALSRGEVRPAWCAARPRTLLRTATDGASDSTGCTAIVSARFARACPGHPGVPGAGARVDRRRPHPPPRDAVRQVDRPAGRVAGRSAWPCCTVAVPGRRSDPAGVPGRSPRRGAVSGRLRTAERAAPSAPVAVWPLDDRGERRPLTAAASTGLLRWSASVLGARSGVDLHDDRGWSSTAARRRSTPQSASGGSSPAEVARSCARRDPPTGRAAQAAHTAGSARDDDVSPAPPQQPAPELAGHRTCPCAAPDPRRLQRATETGSGRSAALHGGWPATGPCT